MSFKINRLFRQFKSVRFWICTFLITTILVSMSAAIAGSKHKIKIMPLGDSITGSFSGMASYRFWLWQQLVAAGFGDKVEFVGQRCGTGDVDGYCGEPKYDNSVWSSRHNGFHDKTIRMINGWMRGLMTTDTADIILIHLGSNDIISPDAEPNLLVSKTLMGNLIDNARSVNPHATILLCQIIPSAFSPEKYAVLNSYFADLANEKTTAESPIILVDQHTGFNANTDCFDSPPVHPNESGEKKMAYKFFTALLPVLQKMTGIQSIITSYSHDLQISAGIPYSIDVKAHAFPQVQDVTIYNGTTILGSAVKANDSSYTFDFTAPQPGTYTIKAVVNDFSGHSDTSKSILFDSPVNTNPLTTTIPEIQGSTDQSPLINTLVLTHGVVTAITKDSTGFWMQDILGDGNALTSDAVYVVRSASINLPAKGDLIEVRGIVQEYQTSTNCYSTTRITCVDSIAILSSNHSLPPAVTINYLSGSTNGISSLRAGYSSHEGMIVKFANTAIVAPSLNCAFLPSGNLTPGSGFYASSRVVINESRGGLNNVDYNPEVFLMGSKTGDIPNVGARDTLFSLTGIFDYDNGWYYIQPIPELLSASHSPTPSAPVSKRSSSTGSFRITTFDLGGLFDTLDTWGKDDPVSSSATYNAKITKLRKAIVSELLTPALICFQNVENTGILNDLAKNVNSIASGKYKAATARSYMGFSVDQPSSPDPRGLTNGFLYDTTQITLDSLMLMSGSAIDSSFGQFSPKPTAEPLVGYFSVLNTKLAVINICLADKSSDSPYFANVWPIYEPSKLIRSKQAHAVRSRVNSILSSSPYLPMMVAGEFNDYSFAELLDTTDFPFSILCGKTSIGESVFTNTDSYIPNNSRYTCINNGRAEMNSHILLNSNLLRFAKAIDVLHFNSNFENSFVIDTTNAIRSSQHDPVEMRF